MDIPSNKQLIPYNPEQHRIVPQTAKFAGSAANLAHGGLMRDNLLHPRDFSIIITLPDHHEPEYNVNLRLKTSKLNRVGLLIDIYA
jgi:hypothetical protein